MGNIDPTSGKVREQFWPRDRADQGMLAIRAFRLRTKPKATAAGRDSLVGLSDFPA
jgi:hypothetical protein